ncbi:LexA family transcriptional regulator [uncultured Amphritea sp.]|uniref:XRE family transcriptional regulator n=1 Tax=uncultured Amphritea sp. TaxID=981605 RepID=UPI0026370BCF|nr:LexA family transcriptional regulator [uncultured Amphritea sp.]
MTHNVSLLAFQVQPQLTNFVSKIANMSIGENVRTLRKEKGWTQEELARRISISRGRIAQIEKDSHADVKADTLLSLAKAFGCSPNDLKNGWQTESDPLNHFQTHMVDIPVLDVELAAGNGTHVDAEKVKEWVPMSQDWILQNNLYDQNLVIVKVRGESMKPRLQDGDLLLIDKSDKKPVSGNIYAIATDDDLRVKRLQKRIDGAWVISSDNKADPTYQDEIISHHNFERLRIIGRAVRVLMGNL